MHGLWVLMPLLLAILCCLLAYKLIPDRTMAFVVSLVACILIFGGYFGIGHAHAMPPVAPKAALP